MGSSAATIYDVARAAGVSPSTVSRAYSRPGRVASETYDRVMGAAETLGYRAAVVGPGRPRCRTGVIALVVPDAASEFDAHVIYRARAAATAAGYTLAVVLLGADDQGWEEREAIERVLGAADGLLLSAPRMSDASIRVIARQRPTVVLHRMVVDVPSVARDNLGGVRLALGHLARLGHREVTYVAGPANSWASGVRWRAVRDSAPAYGLASRRLGPFEPSAAGGRAAARELAAQPTTAVIAFNEPMALGLVHGLTERGWSVPGDVSVVGVDGLGSAALASPPLTTIACRVEEICTRAMRSLDQIIHDAPASVPLRQSVPVWLVARASSGPRRPRALAGH